MKFVLLCDVVRVPDSADAVLGARLTGAAVQSDTSGEDLDAALDALFGGLVGMPLPAPTGFEAYRATLMNQAGPLFPWLGASTKFALGHTGDDPTPNPTSLPPPPPQGATGVTSTLKSLPAGFEMTADSRAALLYAAVSDLTSDAMTNEPTPRPRRTNKFQNRLPFILRGWNDSTSQQQTIQEVSGESAAFSYEAFMAALASLPAPIPHGKLGLSAFLSYTPPSIAGKRVLVVAAPTLELESGVEYRPDWAHTTWQRIDARQVFATIPYLDAFGGFAIEARCRALDLSEDLASDQSFLDRESLWVRRSLDGSGPHAGVSFEDWLAKLPEQLADSFDLPRLLLQVLEDRSRATKLAADVGSGTDRVTGAKKMSCAVLLALRDIVGPGCIAVSPTSTVEGPNGSPAHAGILSLVNEMVRSTRSDVALDQNGLRDLAEKIVAADDNFRRHTSPIDGWFAVLAKLLGSSLNLPDTAPEFVDKIAQQVANSALATGPFDPAPLRRLVDAATRPANAAAIQVALWRNVGPPTGVTPAAFELWLNAAGDAFSQLLQQRFRLVETLRKANIDLPWVDKAAGLWRQGAANQSDLELLQGWTDPTSHTEVRGHIRDSIVDYVMGTLCAPYGNPTGLEKSYQDRHGRFEQFPVAARPILGEAIDAAVKGRVKSWFERPEKETSGDTLLEGGLAPDAHGVILQIDRLVTGPNKVAGVTPPDFNEDLAGYGLLMRRLAPAKESWRSLTSVFANINPDGAPITELSFENGSHVILGALPVGYSAAMPQATVTYDNRPILGDDLSYRPTLVQHPADPRIIQLYQPVKGQSPPDETILPFLAYGATYEAAPFGVSNHGAMPVDIRGDYPALLAPEKLLPTFQPSRADVVRRFTYLRRTGIGALHVTPVLAEAQKNGGVFHPMFVPKEAKPLAEEILLPPDVANPWLTTIDKSAKALQLKTALLLSEKDGKPLEFGGVDCGRIELRIEAPLTPIEDFDRWIALDELSKTGAEKDEMRKFRGDLRQRYQKQAEEIGDKIQALEIQIETATPEQAKLLREQIEALKRELELQDPAVRKLYVHVTRVRRGGKYDDAAAHHSESAFLDWRWEWKPGMDAGKPFADARLPVKLLCKLDATGTKPLFENAVEKTVWIAAGDVAIVRLFAAVPAILFEGKPDPDGQRRFDRSVSKKSTATVPNPDEHGTEYQLFSLHALAVEGASLTLPEERTLWRTVTANIVEQADRAADEQVADVRVNFTRLGSGDASKEMDAVGSITIGSQAWRWTGRPLPAFPFHKAKNLNGFPPDAPQDPWPTPAGNPDLPSPADYAFLWDVQGFAERLDETLDDQTVAVPIRERIETAVSVPLAQRVALNSPNRPDIARYLRFRVVAHSRYAAAYRAAGKDLKPVRAKSSENNWSTDWFRVLRPASPPNAVPKPSIRAVIPLTRAVTEGEPPNPVAGILVVVDGAWFEHAGLADWLLAGVETAYRSKLVTDSGPVKATAAEMGPDPLLRTYGLGQTPQHTPTGPAEFTNAVPLTLSGPLGHGFDSGTATGLYLNSSFVVNAPPFMAGDSTAWWMGKLSFRRLVLAEGTTGYWPTVNSSSGTSDPSNPQVAVNVHDLRVNDVAASASLALTVRGTLHGKNASVKIDAIGLNGKWTFKVDTKEVKEIALTERVLDLRVLALRRISVIDPNDAALKDKHYAWYEIMVLVHPRNRAWFPLFQTRWYFDEKDETENDQLSLQVDAVPTNVTLNGPSLNQIAQISEATEGRWTQFLPNAETLRRLGEIKLDGLVLSVGKDVSTLSLTAGGQSPAWLGTDAVATQRKQGQPDQGLFNLLLVTRRVASVSGAEEEAYVGLYHSSAEGISGAGTEVVLQWFGKDAEKPKDLSSQNLIGRILTIRVGNPANASKIAEWKFDPWKHVFPPEDSSDDVLTNDGSRVFGQKRPGDADLQIIEIYAPILAAVEAGS